MSDPPTSTYGGEVSFAYDADLFRAHEVEVPDGFFPIVDEDGTIAVLSLSVAGLPESGLFVHIIFEVTGQIATQGSIIRVNRLHIGNVDADVSRAQLTVVLSASVLGDFDGDGLVRFGDFILFAGSYGKARGDAGYDVKYDMDGSGRIGFEDFILFAGAYGA